MKTMQILLKSVKAMGAFLLVMVMLAGFASCTDVVDNPVPTDVIVEQPDEEPLPMADQMTTRVTVDMPTYVRTPFDEGTTGDALVKRLPVTTSNYEPNTRLVLLREKDFDEGKPLTDDEWMMLARHYMNGGYIAIERPRTYSLAFFGVQLYMVLTYLEEEALKQTFDIDGEAAAAAARKMEVAERLQMRQETLKQMARSASTRAEEDPIWGEMYILGPTAYFLQDPLEAQHQTTVSSEDSEGNVTAAEEQTVAVTRTAAMSGQMADAVAEWLNWVAKDEEEQASAAPRRAITRADGEGAINTLMSASEEFTHVGAIDWRNWDNDTRKYTNRVKTTVRSWGVHDMDSNKDYYFLEQKVSLALGNQNGWKIFYPISEENCWYDASNYGKYDSWYGAFLSQYETSMNLDGNAGTIHLEDAMPNTDNNNATKNITVGESTTTSHSVGFTFGGNGGASGSGPQVGLNFGVTNTWGTSHTNSFSMSMITNTKELAVKKNTLGEKVTWTYKGTLPEYYEKHTDGKIKHCHQDAAPILVNDCDLTNQICWSVANPEGAYTVDITSTPQTAALLFCHDRKTNCPHKYEYTTTETANISHTLLQPNRAMQHWRMFITIDEWVDNPVQGAQSELESAIIKGFSDIYAPQFNVADKTPTSMEGINYVVDYSKDKFGKNIDILRNYGRSWGIRKYSIHWRCDDLNVGTREPFVVEQSIIPDGTAYAVWCESNSTLYFLNSTSTLKEGDTWSGQAITKVWSGADITHSSNHFFTAWFEDTYQKVTRVVFDPSFADVRPTSCARWFNNFKSLASIEGLEYLNTSEVTTMAQMFTSCIALTTIDASVFDMSRVTDVDYMFCNCSKLTTIYSDQAWNISKSSFMFGECANLKGAVSYDIFKTNAAMANPETGYFTWPENNAKFITLNENSSNRNMLKRYEGKTVNVRYARTLTAKNADDGTVTPVPYSVSLPYDLDLSEAVNAGQVDIYTLAAVANGEFVFAKLDITTLEAGKPYVLRINKGSLSLSANKVVISAVTPLTTPVYSSLAAWRRGSGTVVGDFVANFDLLSATDAADDNAFAMQVSDHRWDYYKPTDNARIPAFRAYLSSSTIEKTAYKARFSE